MWVQSPDLNGDGSIDANDKLTYDQAMSSADSVTTAGCTDWRLPTIKELYSLILFSGYDVSGYSGSTAGLIPFNDTDAFAFGCGDESTGERVKEVEKKRREATLQSNQ